MRGSPATAAILETLNATRATAKERHAEMERKIRQVQPFFSHPYPSSRPLATPADILFTVSYAEADLL